MEESKLIIDALPYIDQLGFSKVSKASIEELIEKEIKVIDKSKIDKEIEERYCSDSNKDISQFKKIEKTVAPLKESFEVPSMSKYYNEEEWDKLFEELDYTIESKQIENLNLELINTYASAHWNSFISKSMNLANKLKEEKDTLNTDILFLNKKRKYDQTIYQNELNNYDKKINATLAQISLIETELKNK